MAEFKIEQTEKEGMYTVTLYSNGKFIKKVAECYEEDYAILVASSLAKNSGSKFDSNVKRYY